MSEAIEQVLDTLRDFAAGITPLGAFHDWLVNTLIVDGPEISRDDSGELSATFSFVSECAMYLDMVTDIDDPNFDEAEARRLAGSFCAIITQVRDPELRSAAAHLARWAPSTAAKIRDTLTGVLARPAFERFISRRPWPQHHRAAVKHLSRESLTTLAEGLELNDYARALRAFA